MLHGWYTSGSQSAEYFSGLGYRLLITKLPDFNSFDVTNMVQTYVPNALMLSDDTMELHFNLPMEDSNAFEALFTSLDNEKKSLKIRSYKISIMTLEEIFTRQQFVVLPFKLSLSD